MTTNRDVYRVITPLGPVVATFAEDSPVQFAGHDGAVQCVLTVLKSATNSLGRSITIDSLEPHDFYHFCQPEGSGITIMQPLEDMLDDVLSKEALGAVLDSVNLAAVGELAGLLRDMAQIGDGPDDLLAKLRLAGQIRAIMQRLGEDVDGGGDAEATEADGLSDDPTADNYRFRDTGYIADSRKEQAASLIRIARESGSRVIATDIDWEAIESNPRAAAEIITKSNLFGQTDWQRLRDGGMEPGAGFLIDRIYAAIAPAPTGDSVQTRKDYALALQTIRDRLETCSTAVEVTDVLQDIRQELTGVQLNAEEAARYEVVQSALDEASQLRSSLRRERETLAKEANKFSYEINGHENDQSGRERRGWKRQPEIDARIAELKPQRDAALAVIDDWDKAHPENKEEYVTTKTPDGGISSRVAGVLVDRITELSKKRALIERGAQVRNMVESPLTRGWLTFGERFFALLNYRSHKGSDAFAGHVTNAKAGRIVDWDFAEKERVTVKKATKQEIGFRLKVADKYERVGGKSLAVGSTFALKDMLGFRDVQSGNWVLKDPNSAKFHVQQTAHAMLDMSDVLGIDAKSLGLNGRLGMAFGARGHGNAGFGGAAAAHYESVHRVINLTKMGGGGSLGHEWFHAIDDMLGELATGETSKARNFASADASVLPAGPLRDAMADVTLAMQSGSVRLPETIKIGPKDKRNATYNIDSARAGTVAVLIKAAGSLDGAVLAVDGYFDGMTGKRSLKNLKQWRTLAAAYYAEDGVDSVRASTGPNVSSFMAEAVVLDGGVSGKYWSKPLEMAARAFQSFLEDKLATESRRNDYLSVYADNKYHFDPILQVQWNPYPEGEERERLNQAFEKLFAAIRDERVFERASENRALLDSIFGGS